ncbi:MAG: phenylalanine--tRNA ligase subunit beta, partial [Steroidobacteraceae bacterium]|nr:phenylalanine--tRNA ligase subunit beta [Steroidobacteraceae bacterium]
AGIMGGERTAVTRATADVFLEVAWFEPAVIAGRARRLGLATEASQRFERGVDPTLQERAMTMATALLQQVAGGTAGPIVAADTGQAPLEPLAVPLRRSQLQRLLGRAVADSVVERTLRGLGLRITANADGWTASAPAHRFDLAIEADLIEEIARIGGYEQVPADAPRVAQRIMPVPESQPAERSILELLAARGYQEAVHYGFVDPKLQALLFPDVEPVRLVNPIAEDLGVMRLSLWPNLIRAARDNLRRQQNRVKLCELGATFASDGTETERIAAIWTGLRHDEQWGSARSELRALADFHDLRGDLAALCSLCGDASVFELHPASLGCLHPGRSAAIYRDGRLVGYIGELHPELVLKLDLTYSPQLFELERSSLRALHVQPRNLSPFPFIRRDLAVVVDEPVTFSALRERVTLIAGEALSELRCFDVYRGAGVETGRKSIALGLIFQDNSRTLTDEDADRLMAAIRSDLGASLNARIRE